MSNAQRTALHARVAVRKQQLIFELLEHKKESSRVGAADAIDRIKAQLSDLDHLVKLDSWANLDAHAKRRIEDWIAR